jgi:Tfp pilus assembly protein PilF
VSVLLDGLDHPDDVIRRTFFDAFFAATGLHLSYDPDAPRRDRLDAIAALRSLWEQKGGTEMLRRPASQSPASYERAWRLVEELGGGTDVKSGGDDAALLDRLVAMQADAVAPLIQGLAFPAGFTRKRALVCEALGKIGDARAAPYLVRALRDPNLSVSAWACWALERTGDAASLPALRRYSRRLASFADGHPDAAGTESPEQLLARALRTRIALGDASAGPQIDALGAGTTAGTSASTSANASASASAPPAPVGAMVRTTEAQPVPVPTSPQDAIAKATALRAQDYYEDAVAALKDSDARFGATAGTRLEMAWNLLMTAEEDMTRDLDQARIDAEVADARLRFDEAVRMDPQVAGRERLEAWILRYEGENEKARRVIEDFVARHPADPFAHQELGHFAFKDGDWAVAEREYAALAVLSPSDGWAVLYRTIARQRLGHPAAELDAGFLAAAHLLPEIDAPLQSLARLHAAEPDRFLELLQKVVDGRPRAVRARIWIAYVQRTRTTPDVARAEAVLREALAIAPKDQAVHFNLGQLHESQGRTPDAVREYVASVDAGAIGDVAAAADALDRLLTAPASEDAVPADLRARAWDAVVARSLSTGRYAHDAGTWYAGTAHDPIAARRYFEAAAAAEPDNETYRADVLRAKSDPRLGQ